MYGKPDRGRPLSHDYFCFCTELSFLLHCSCCWFAHTSFQDKTLTSPPPPPSGGEAEQSVVDASVATTSETLTEKSSALTPVTAPVAVATAPPAAPVAPPAASVPTTKDVPKRLHVSNIPFRYREPDLRNLFGVSNIKKRRIMAMIIVAILIICDVIATLVLQ